MPVPPPYPAAWDRMPPGATDFSTWSDVDLTRIPAWLLQLWCARLEWKWCLGTLRWPAGNSVWNIDAPDHSPPYDNIITAASENLDGSVTITCSAANWIGIGRNPWKTTGESDATGAETPVWIPDGASSYDAVIEVGPAGDSPEDDADFAKKAACDAARTIRAHVTSRESATSLKTAPMRDFVTSNQLTSLSELIGRRIYLIKTGGEWPNLRWPAWANAEEVERGTVGAYNATSLTIKEDLMPTRRRWVRDRFNPAGGQAYELIVRGGNGLMRRLPIVVDMTSGIASDEVGTVYFAAQESPTWGASGVCVIVRAGERYLLGHEKHQPWRWYSGARAFWWCHTGEKGSLSGWLDKSMLPAGGVTWDEYDAMMEACLPVDHSPAMDNDMWSAFDEFCGAWELSEKSYSPHLFKTLRQIQADQDGDAGTAIEPGIDYTGREGIPNMTIPILYRKAGVNARTTTTSAYDAATGHVTIGAVDMPYVPIVVYYTIKVYGTTGELLASYCDGSITRSVTGAFTVTLEPGLDPTKINGAAVDITFGRSRFTPRQFYTMFPRTCRIPDTDPRPEHAGEVVEIRHVVDWDNYGNAGVGKWTRREPSTTYTPQSASGGTLDAFANGDLARWVSTGWNIPVDGPDAGAFLLPPLLPYYDHFYDGLHPSSVQLKTVAQQVEGVTGRPDTGYPERRLPAGAVESRYHFTDPAKDWYRDIWSSGSGYGHVESGTCTSGSTTSFSDSSKLTGTLTGAFWESDEFEGFASPYLHFPIEFQLPTVVEILDPATGAVTGSETKDVWHERVLTVTSADGSGVHGTWAEPLPTSCDGKPWRIREPEYQLNRWDGRRVRLHLASGTVEVKGIATGPNTFHLLTPLASAIPLGTSYEILDYVPGTVWQQAAAAPVDGRPYVDQGGGYFWIAPRGADVHRTGIADNPPANFHIQQNENEPTYVKRYGRIEKDDQIRIKNLYTELVAIENVFRWLKVTSVSYHSRADLAVAENNSRIITASSDEFYDPPRSVENVYADVLSSFQAVYGGGFGGPTLGETEPPPVPHNTITATYYDSGPSGGAYGAGMDSVEVSGYAYVTGAYSPLLSSDADLYCYCELYADGRDPGQTPPAADIYEYTPAVGDPYLALHSDPTVPPNPVDSVGLDSFNAAGTTMQFRKFAKFSLSAPDGTGLRKSGKIGSASSTVTPTEPPYLHLDSNHLTKSASTIDGFYVTNSVAVVRFDVPGGRKMLLP